jgi:hypothetical protein
MRKGTNGKRNGRRQDELERTGFLVCKNIVPGPVNLHTKPSPDVNPEMIPPDATLSRTYFVFHATK